MSVSPELLCRFAHKPTTRLLTAVRFRTVCFHGGLGSLVLLRFCRFGWGAFWRHRASAFGSDYSIVAPLGLRACSTWVRKSLNFILVSGRFSWVGLFASFGGSPLGLLFPWERLSRLVSFVRVYGYPGLSGTPAMASSRILAAYAGLLE